MPPQAARDFQAEHRDWDGKPLRADGVLGPRTRWALAVADLPRWRRDVIRIATNYIGIVEEPLGSNRGHFVDAFLAPGGVGLGQPWCAAFVSWVLREAGLEVSGGYHVSAAKLLRSLWPQVGEVLPGDVFGWVNPDGTGHCGFVLGVAPRIGTLATVEGNSEHRVRVCWRPRRDLQIGTLRPDEHQPIVAEAPLVERSKAGTR